MYKRYMPVVGLLLVYVLCTYCKVNSLSTRTPHRAPPPRTPPPTDPCGPTFLNSEKCCGSENAMPPKFFWDMDGHRGNFMSKNVIFSTKNIYFEKNS